MTTRIEFQREMTALHQEIIRMGAAVEDAINMALQALTEMNADLARRVIANDDVIDEMERTIDLHCTTLIARQQPVANDLRDVTSTLKLITDLERIADHASDISERILAFCELGQPIVVPHDIVTIISAAREMLHAALESYVARDEERAANTILMDERVDNLFNHLKKYLTHLMSVDSANVASLVEMLLIAKYAERIADHAQNVAEWVLFFIRGRHVIHS